MKLKYLINYLSILPLSFSNCSIACGADGKTIDLNINNNIKTKGYFNDTYYNYSRQYNTLSLEKARNSYNPNKIIRIAVMDSGISLENDDLNYFVNNTSTYIINKELSKNFNPAVNTAFATMNSSNYDDTNHGTLVSSVIAAEQNNNFGIAGITNNVELISIRIFDENGNNPSNTDYIADAITYCQSINCDIINYSGHFVTNNSKIKNAIKNFDGLFICAAGNEGSDISNIECYPAKWNLSNTIVVGNLNSSNEICTDSKYPSNWSNKYVDIFAPGDKVGALDNEGYFKGALGTSFSTPMITGLAAMYLSHYGNISSINLKKLILNSGDEISSLKQYCVTSRKANAYKLIHDHSFSYERFSTKKHYQICNDCGFYYEKSHVVAGGSFENGQRYATCLICGGQAEMGLEMTTSNNSNNIEFVYIDGLYYSKKTSYIDGVYNLSYEEYKNNY